ncbi:hypothetical protein TNCV_1126311 [Trichonephila clavipes]|nr:hypothetical protein TNCV_1126311 [Trichonephila clavipes]
MSAKATKRPLKDMRDIRVMSFSALRVASATDLLSGIYLSKLYKDNVNDNEKDDDLENDYIDLINNDVGSGADILDVEEMP